MVHEHRALRDARRDGHAGCHDTVVVVELNPVVVAHADLAGILLAHPDRLAAAEQRQHLLAVEVHRVDGPLVVRRQVLQRDLLRTAQEILDGAVVEDRLEGRHGLAVLAHHLVVEIEGLAPRHGAERHEFLDIRRERRVAAALIAARKRRRRDGLLRLRGDFIEREALVLAVLGQMLEALEARLLVEALEGLDGDLAVRRRREAHDGLDGLARIVDRRHAVRDEVLVLDDTVALADLLVLIRGIPGHRERTHLLGDIRSERDPLLVRLRVVALDRHEIRHRLARDGLALALAPVAHEALRLSRLALAVVADWHSDEVFIRLELGFLGDLRDGLCERAEDIPVTLGFPERVDSGLERMDKRMHVRRRDIVLLVPRGRRQHDIGVECRARHAEVDVDEQVELALGSAARLLELLLLAPLDLRRALFLGKDRVLRAEQVLVEEVVALGRRAEQVRRPDEEVAREVLRSIRVLCRELQALVLEGIHDVLLEVLALRLRFVRQLLAALVERRVRRQPAETL